MNYKQLTQKETDIWISDLDKTTDLIAKLKEYYFNIIDQRAKDEFMKYYKNTFKWKHIYDHEFSDLILLKDGHHYACLITGIKKLEKITTYTPEEMEIHHYLINNSKVLLKHFKEMVDTYQMWIVYAHQPFQINVDDLTMYFKIKQTHKKVKELLQGVNAYDETFNLDEDC